MGRNTRLTRTCIAAVATAGMALAAPAAAGAEAMSETGTTMTYQAGIGETNTIKIFGFTRSPANSPGVPFNNSYDILGAGSGLVLGNGCVSYKHPISVVANRFCQRDGITRIVVQLGDLNDGVSLATLAGNPFASEVRIPALINGGPGNDQLTGGGGDDDITGGSGVNTVHGLDGNDRLRLRNRVRDGVIDCGNGLDTAILDKIDPRPIGCETILRPR